MTSITIVSSLECDERGRLVVYAGKSIFVCSTSCCIAVLGRRARAQNEMVMYRDHGKQTCMESRYDHCKDTKWGRVCSSVCGRFQKWNALNHSYKQIVNYELRWTSVQGFWIQAKEYKRKRKVNLILFKLKNPHKMNPTAPICQCSEVKPSDDCWAPRPREVLWWSF